MKKNEMIFYQLLRDYLNDYLVTRRNFSTKTIRAYRQAFVLLRHYCFEVKGIRFDQMDFSCFSRGYVYDFLVWLRDTRGNSASTINLRLSSIKSFLKFCGEEEMELMPLYLEVAGIHAFRGTQKMSVDYLTPKQLKLLFSLPDMTTRLGRRDRLFMILAYESGARMQELLDMRLNGILRSDTGVRIRVYGKGNKIRYVPLLKTTVKHLDAYLSEFHDGSSSEAFLFYTIHSGLQTQMSPGTVDYFLKKYGRIAHEVNSDFPQRLHAHMLRHSIAMSMYKNGIPISYIRDFLGHRSVTTTSIYSHADEEIVAKALESIEDVHAKVEAVMCQKAWKGKEQYLLQYCGLI